MFKGAAFKPAAFKPGAFKMIEVLPPEPRYPLPIFRRRRR